MNKTYEQEIHEEVTKLASGRTTYSLARELLGVRVELQEARKRAGAYHDSLDRMQDTLEQMEAEEGQEIIALIGERDTLAAHVEAIRAAYMQSTAGSVTHENRSARLITVGRVLTQSPATSLAKLKAQAAKEFAAELAESCKMNGEIGEPFGMAISGPTECSDVAPCLRAARAVFLEAERLADWRYRQSERGDV